MNGQSIIGLQSLHIYNAGKHYFSLVKPPTLKGPLPMYPPADDNYGSESCAIAALGGTDTPVAVVIASASAVLYHCLLLPDVSTPFKLQ